MRKIGKMHVHPYTIWSDLTILAAEQEHGMLQQQGRVCEPDASRDGSCSGRPMDGPAAVAIGRRYLGPVRENCRP